MTNFDNNLNLGKLGEDKLSTWCTEACLTSNRSLEEDRMGWDHFIEFPYIRSHLPRDKQEKPIECKIQVKSTLRTDKSVNIKLSSLKRLVDYTSPAFILFYEFNDKQHPKLESSYLVHVDEYLIGRVLKKIRENDISESPKELYDIKLKITYGQKHKLSKNNGTELRELIVSYLPDGMPKYQQNKHMITENVGYENNGYQVDFKVKYNDLESYIVSSALGLSSSLEVSDIVTKDKRFELKGVELRRSETATIEIYPNVLNRSKIYFKTSLHAPSISFDCEVLILPSLRPEQNKFLFKTALFSIEVINDIDSKKLIPKIHYTLQNQSTLEETLKFFKLFNPNNSGKKFIFEVKPEEGGLELSLKCIMKHAFPDATALAEVINDLRNSFGIDSSTMVNINDLYTQEVIFKTILSLITNQIDKIKVSLSESMDGDKIMGMERFRSPLTLLADVGKTTIGVISLIHSYKTEELKYKTSNIDILEILTFHGQRPKLEALLNMEKEALERVDKSLDT